MATHLYGQEINAETYAICKADLLLKGRGAVADNIVGGPQHSTLSNDAFPTIEFDFMLSNPPYGKSWKTDLERICPPKSVKCGGQRGEIARFDRKCIHNPPSMAENVHLAKVRGLAAKAQSPATVTHRHRPPPNAGALPGARRYPVACSNA